MGASQAKCLLQLHTNKSLLQWRLSWAHFRVLPEIGSLRWLLHSSLIVSRMFTAFRCCSWIYRTQATLPGTMTSRCWLGKCWIHAALCGGVRTEIRAPGWCHVTAVPWRAMGPHSKSCLSATCSSSTQQGCWLSGLQAPSISLENSNYCFLCARGWFRINPFLLVLHPVLICLSLQTDSGDQEDPLSSPISSRKPTQMPNLPPLLSWALTEPCSVLSLSPSMSHLYSFIQENSQSTYRRWDKPVVQALTESQTRAMRQHAHLMNTMTPKSEAVSNTPLPLPLHLAGFCAVCGLVPILQGNCQWSRPTVPSRVP
jgi:hypothetical protein